ncbi:hypothetical protein GDO86_018434 [Hymenochirus boettgeri]|uniref:Olfactory receptor n=1 Tax=Hymenochirus boettgeri TaxID=247094 RepID=A0A8T2ILN3_9PIPI|nr:hypothetical protein GDO86_018434 [Hymenochirus boettgeri]
MKNLLVFIFLNLYLWTLCGNLMITGIYVRSENLHSPMYFFLSHLSTCDIFLSTSVVPVLLCTLLRGETTYTMTIGGCVIQYLTSASFAVVECFILTVMSYDRFLAICKPLHYNTIMTSKFCLHLVMWIWLLGFLISLSVVIMMSLLGFCGPEIDYVYCDFKPLIQASCSDTSYMELFVIGLTFPIIVCPFIFILLTYVFIFLAILVIPSSTGREKAFSTCSSHLTVVCTYYGILIAKYAVPVGGQSLGISKIISVLYTAVTPLVNPIIYSLPEPRD